MKQYLLILFLSLFFVSQSLGQQDIIDFPSMRWNTYHGLKSLRVDDVAADSRGVIWVSTIEGLYRHNGHNFDNINTLVDNSPFDNPIRGYDIYIDDKDRLWIGTWQNGLMMYDIQKNTLRHFKQLIDESNNLSQLRIYGLHTLNDTILRLTSHTHGLIDYNIIQDSFEIIDVFNNTEELDKMDGFQRMLKPLNAANSKRVENWYLSLTGMVNYDTKLDSFIYYDGGRFKTIRDGVMDKDSMVWCVTYGQGIYSFNLKNKKFTNYRCAEGEDWSKSCLTGATIEIYNDSTLIFDTSNRLYYFNKNSHEFTAFNDILPFGLWSGITEELEWINGELWMASWSSTLYRHFKDNHGVVSLSSRSELQEVYYDSFKDRYISVSFPNLITIHKGPDIKEIRVPLEILNGNYVEGVTNDLNGNLWIVDNDQVINYDEEKNSYSFPFKKLLNDIKSDLTFRKIGTNPNGTIWAASHDGTIFSFDPVSLEYKFYGGTRKESIPIEFNYRAHLEGFSQDAYSWFSAQDGFFAISPNDNNHKFAKNLKDYQTKEPITLLSPFIGIGNDNHICFGSKTHGIYTINSDSLNGGFAHKIELSHLIPNIAITDIEIDSRGIIWVATAMGLIQIDKANDRIELYGDRHRLFDIQDLELQEGKFPLAISKNDILIVDPDKLKPFPGTPNIQLLDAELDAVPLINEDGTKLKTGTTIHLGPNDNYLRIQFNDFNYVSQRPKSYAIKIEGFHDDWIDLSDRTEFGFSGLSGGTSQILIKSKLQFEKEYSNPIKLLTIIVTPPITQRKSFWAFCIGLLMFLFYLGYRYRLSQYKEKQNLIIAFNKQLAETEMKALRAQMNPHFLFNVLNAIKLNVQKNEQENAIDFITDFSKLIRSVLQNSGKKRISLEEELQALELYIKIERKRFSTSFDYHFETDETIDLENITIPPMLLQPYVENAIWHGILHKSEGKGEIHVITSKTNNNIVIEIEDNGIGRERANKLKLKSAQKNKSMGMQITQDRMAISNMLSNDQIEVEIIDLYDEDKNARGTKVVVKLLNIQ